MAAREGEPTMAAGNRVKRSVSLYSFQEEYYYGRLDLEGCLSAVASTGATGVEVLAEAMFPDFPNPSPDRVRSWSPLSAAVFAGPIYTCVITVIT